MSVSHFFVGRGRAEVAVEKVVWRWADLSEVRAITATPGGRDDKAFLLHEAVHDLLRDADALLVQRRAHATVAIAPMVALEDLVERAPNFDVPVSAIELSSMVEGREARCAAPMTSAGVTRFSSRTHVVSDARPGYPRAFMVAAIQRP